MTIEKGPTSVAEALELGIQMADAGHVAPAGVADDDEGGDGGTDDSSTDTNADAAGGEADGQDQGDGTADSGAAGADGDGGEPAGDADGAAADGAGDSADDAAGADKADPAKAGTEEGKPGVKKPDHFNDPIPNALKPATKERIRFLANEATTAKTSLTKVTGERDELIKAITDTGASPQQYAGVLDYLELVNSNDQNKLKQAANFMIRELSALSRVGGFRIPGITSYAGHPDLEKAVAEGKMTQEIAEELAASRAATTHQGKVGAAQAQASAARKAYEQADHQARLDMNVIEASYRKADPLYKEKQPMIIGMLNTMIRGDRAKGIPPLHPSKWAEAYKNIYENLPKTLGGMRPVNRNLNPGGKVPANQPLRTQQPAGATKPEPKSVAEALEMGIEMARGA